VLGVLRLICVTLSACSESVSASFHDEAFWILASTSRTSCSEGRNREAMRAAMFITY
jgi:hypothetical protein